MKRFGVLFVLLAVIAVLAVVSVAQEEPAGNLIDIETHPYAAQLESRAYAAAQGATAEFRKMEWIAVDNERMLVYVAMSSVTRGMSDGEGDIQVDENPCGIVYVGEMDESYTISALRPLIVGGPYDPEGGANKCSVDNISEPDGLFVDAMGRLWIGEDTGNHENNMVWVYDPADGSLTRFAHVPLGAEVTGLYVTDNGTVFWNIQHPSAMNIYPFNASSIGVIAGFNAYEDEITEISMPEGDEKLVARTAVGEYQVLQRNGDPLPGDPYGRVAGQVVRADGETQFFCNQADGNMWIPTNEAGTIGYLYSNWECRPGGLSRLHLSMNEDRTWEVLDGEVVDFHSVNGTWTNCGASVTPWNTALTSEEYEPYAGDFNSVAPMTEYLGRQANPYDYGFAVELAPQAVGNDIEKRYAMGRLSWEMGIVAGDERTVYIGDDGTDVVLFRFVADEAGDLGCGTLYAAAITQEGGPGADHVFQIEWVELGSACDEDVEAAIRELDPTAQ